MLVTSSAINRDGSRASAPATARRCNSPPDRPPVSRSARSSRPTSRSSLSTSVFVPGGRPTPRRQRRGCQNLTLRVLQDRRRATEPAEPDRPGPVDRSRGRLAPGQHQHQRRLAGPVGAGDGDVFAGFDDHRHLAQRVVLGAGITEADVVQPCRHRSDGPGVRSRAPACARRGCPSRRFITLDSADHPTRLTTMMRPHRRPAEQIPASDANEVAKSRFSRSPRPACPTRPKNNGEPVHIGGHRITIRWRSRARPSAPDDRHAEDHSGDQRGRAAPSVYRARAFDDSRQPADVSALDRPPSSRPRRRSGTR